MKKPRNTQKEVDLTTLLDPEKLMSDNPDDCFGRSWEPQDKDCAVCHDVEICGIVKQEEIKGKVKKLEKEKGPFLDQTAFDNVPIEKIVTEMKNWAEENDPATYDELEETIAKSAKTKDTVAIREYIKRMLPRYGLIITEEKTVVSYESANSNSVTKSPLTKEGSFDPEV